MHKQTKATAILSVLLLFSGCIGHGSLSSRKELAYTLSQDGRMEEEQIEAPPFLLTSFQKITMVGEPIHVYIEGDGLAWINRHTPSLNPTPTDPIGLRLALKDLSANVIYLARPCQYTAMMDSKNCNRTYWTDGRFSPDVIKATNNAIDQIKKRTKAPTLTLTGYSGGGGIAALIASKRNDVTLLRTVAGNLDPDEMAFIHHISPLRNSLNPSDYANQISDIPQIHFIGAKDKIITSGISESFKAASMKKDCIQIETVQNASHSRGWVSEWNTLLQISSDCSK